MPNRTCSETDCEAPSRAKGWCARHYYALRDAQCSVSECEQKRRSKDYCASHYSEYWAKSRQCPECKASFTGHSKRKYCSVWCKGQAGRSPVRKAVEAEDWPGVLIAARACSDEDPGGCWIWRFALGSNGYPMIGQGGRGGLVHRHVMRAAIGRAIGDEPVHHKCANRKCVNPEHLQLTTARDNVAEMLARGYLTRRIQALEAALAVECPSHPLLHQIV